jgi:hypothetical protein
LSIANERRLELSLLLFAPQLFQLGAQSLDFGFGSTAGSGFFSNAGLSHAAGSRLGAVSIRNAISVTWKPVSAIGSPSEAGYSTSSASRGRTFSGA